MRGLGRSTFGIGCSARCRSIAALGWLVKVQASLKRSISASGRLGYRRVVRSMFISSRLGLVVASGVVVMIVGYQIAKPPLFRKKATSRADA